ncbi:methionine ABC transporter permease [Bacillus suaedae]|uniref:ABC transporter permease n=1 Tax=Halalkalibacter suaedae TaxID=2822140 RepID=A0A940WXA7_9BACI|nr:methionine ABC transporter permease [Bacillus suaedae]MBP3949926.1 ABC transporter permease [Bacillus suaedae]
MIEQFLSEVKVDKLWEATVETIYMTSISVVATFIIGIILGLVLYLTSEGSLWENRVVNFIFSTIVNVFRSIPFIILIILLIPFTKVLVGTMLGADAALPALIIGTAPFYARMVEIALREIDKGVIEASQAMGANDWDIIRKVLIPESLPALISGITVTSIALISYTAMAGAIGAGGLGHFAYLEGWQRNNSLITLVATVVILIIVFIVQWLGDYFSHKTDKR